MKKTLITLERQILILYFEMKLNKHTERPLKFFLEIGITTEKTRVYIR